MLMQIPFPDWMSKNAFYDLQLWKLYDLQYMYLARIMAQ